MIESTKLSFADRVRHVAALTQKECRQIARDKSALLLGIVLPVILIVLFGYGLSFDISNISLGVDDTVHSEQTQAVFEAVSHNPTFRTERFDSRIKANAALKTFDVEALLVFEKSAGRAACQLLVNGIDAPRANMVSAAVTGAVLGTISKNGSDQTQSGSFGSVEVVTRVWFNESLNSRWYLVPGLFVVVLTLVSCMMTALVIAREWERGTMEALMATPISPLAFLLSKTLPYFVLGMVGWGLCMFAAVGLYGVPIRGSLTLVFAASALYLVFGLGLGLVISSVTRSQFLASQITVLVSSYVLRCQWQKCVFLLRIKPHILIRRASAQR